MRWLLLREYGSLTCFRDDLAWQQKALLRWLLFGEYGLTLYMFIHMSLLLIFNIFGMMLGSNKVNKAKDGSMKRSNLLHVAWDGEIVYDGGISTLGRDHFPLDRKSVV